MTLYHATAKQQHHSEYTHTGASKLIVVYVYV